MKDNSNLAIGNRLLLLQGINLIEHGIEFIEWMNDYKDMNTMDAMTILRDRFRYFKECALADGEHDHMMIDRMTDLANNVQYGFKSRQEIEKRLKALRKEVLNERQAEEKGAS